MYECLVDFNMVEHLYGAAFEPPIDRLGYARILNTERRPYPTKDGHLAVMPYTDENWRALFALAGRPELSADPRFATMTARVRHSDALYALLAELVATRTTAEWQADLDQANIPVMAVRKKEDLIDDPQLAASGYWRLVQHPTEGGLRMPDPPVRFSASPSSIRRMPPGLGEHSAEVLAEAGYTAPEIRALFESRCSLQKEKAA